MVDSDGPDWEPLRPELTQRGFTDITEIGRGGMGYVLRAWDPDLERWVAIKVITRFAASNPENVRRFRSEMRLLGRIHHPAVITVYDGKMRDDLAYFLMSYIPGGTLEQLINQRRGLGRSFTVGEVVSYLRPIAEALDVIHGMQPPVIHRDIKPANILIPAKGSGRSHAVLTDFGISLVGGDTRFTSTGIVIGSEQYMAPERFATEHGEDDGGPSADNYALALIAWEMLTLTPMFSAMSRQNWRFGRRVPPVSVDHLADGDRGHQPELNRVFRRLLANEPRQRPSSAVDAVAQLERAVTGQSSSPVAARASVPAGTAETRPDQLYPWGNRPVSSAAVLATSATRPRRKTGRLVVAATAVVALVAGAAGVVVNNLSSSGASDEDVSLPSWSAAQAELQQVFPGVAPETPGTTGETGLECSPGDPADGQKAQIVCGDTDLKVTLASYNDAASRDEKLGTAEDIDEDLPPCTSAVKRGTENEWILLSDDTESAVFVTGSQADSEYSSFNYCS